MNEKLKSRRLVRTLVRCGALAAAAVLVLPLFPWPAAAKAVPALSPFVMLASTIATRAAGGAALFGLPVLLVVIARRRWFCRWACPVGLMTECAGRLSPVSASRCGPVPRIGRWLVLVSIGAAAAGYPLFLWLDPLAVFTGAVGLAHQPASPAATAAAAALAVVLLLSAALPGVWCLKLCPLGALQELVAVPWRWLQRRLAMTDSSTEANGTDQLLVGPVPRRSLLAAAGGAACAALGVPVGISAQAAGRQWQPRSLRPPGARPLWQFGQLCLRCGNCIRSCPAGIIATGWRSESAAAWLAPVVAFDSDYCREDCVACTQACPSGALAPLRLEEKPNQPIGLAEVLMDRCLLALGSECRAMCMDACPYDAITLHEWTFEDDRRYPIVAEANCPGCGACQVACTPMAAIVVRPAAPPLTGRSAASRNPSD